MRAAILLLTLPFAAFGEPMTGPVMSVSSNFGQWAQPETLERALAFGINDFRDEIHWGRDSLETPETAFPDAMAPATVSVILNLGHPDVEGGHLPVTPEGRAAFAAFAAAVVERFPNVDSIEVGNELNSGDFVSGPFEAADLPERAGLYAALLNDTARAVRAVRPDVRVIGGAAHSLPEAWLAPMMEAGAEMDALAFHPYGVAPEWIGGQIEVVRQIPGLAALPFEATEYGTTDPAVAPGLLIRAHCTMGLAGVSRFAWYPLTARGDGLVPLLGPETPTDAGLAWRLAKERLAGRPLADISPDPFTRACLYGDDTLVLWGAERSVTVPKGVMALDAAGRPLDGPYRLSETAPLILVGTDTVPELGPQRVVADTGLMFDLTGHEEFERFGRVDGTVIDLPAMPGQSAPGTPWRPYRGTPLDGWVRLDPDWLRPGGTADRPLRIVHRWTAPEAMSLLLEVSLDADGPSDVTLLAPGLSVREVFEGAWTASETLTLDAGEVVELAIGPGPDGVGDVVSYRMRLLTP